MKYLIDTHVLIWSLLDTQKLSKNATSIILNHDNDIYVSLISFWEIALKFNIGKLSLKNIKPDELPDYSKEAGFEILYPSETEVSSFYHLPVVNHKDPFDRMIIWQCIQNNIPLISKDTDLAEYISVGLKIIW